MNDYPGIYCIYNVVTEKFYIGSSATVKDRLRGHKTALQGNYHHTKHLQSSWNKRGESSFVFKILRKCKIEECIPLEQYFLNAINPEYNTCEVAGSCLGIKRSDDTKMKLRLSKLGKKRSPEVVEQMRIRATGKTCSVESKLKMSESRIGKKKSEETRLRMCKQIIQIDRKTLETIKEFTSVQEAADYIKVNRGTIRNYLNEKVKHEYIWKFKIKK
jgi:group I intron endonuclease